MILDYFKHFIFVAILINKHRKIGVCRFSGWIRFFKAPGIVHYGTSEYRIKNIESDIFTAICIVVNGHWLTYSLSKRVIGNDPKFNYVDLKQI